jgi:lysophospholipase L1-like esterase
MNRRFLTAGVLSVSMMVGSLAIAQQPGAPTPPTTAPSLTGAKTNTAIVPNLNQGFMNRHTSFVETASQGNIDVLFMGDSITDWWRNPGRAMGGRGRDGQPVQPLPEGVLAAGGKDVFDRHFAGWKIANFGIAGDTTQGVLWRLQNGEGTGYSPKAIMLMIGTNNAGRNSAEEIAMGVAAVVNELRKDFPEGRILLLGIFPRSTPADPVRAKLKQINDIIMTLHDNAHVFYLDIGDKFLAADGTLPREIMADGLHPTNKGYEIWAEAVKPTLEQLMK